MGVDFITLTSNKKNAILLDGSKVELFGYRYCTDSEVNPSFWLHKCKEAQNATRNRAEEIIRKHNPRYITNIDLEERVSKHGRKYKSSVFQEGSLIYKIEEDKRCPALWSDNQNTPNAKPFGFIRKIGGIIYIVNRQVTKDTYRFRQGPSIVEHNRLVEFINDDGEYDRFTYYHEPSSSSDVLTRAITPCGGLYKADVKLNQPDSRP